MPTLIPIEESKAILLWNNFSSSIPEPTPFSFNPFLFFFFQKYFKWKSYYILLYNNQKLSGLLPLVHTGKAYVSLPHFSYGGWLTKKGVEISENRLNKLITLLDEEQTSPGFYRVDLPLIAEGQTDKYPLFVRGLYRLGTKMHPAKVASFMRLPLKQEELNALLSSNLRRKIRKATKKFGNVRFGGEELLNDFYQVYQLRMHQLGSPAYSRSFFSKLLLNSGKESVRVVVAYDEKRPVGGAMLLSYNGFYESAWFATDIKQKKYYVSDYLNESMVRYAVEQGGLIYSFGRSTEHGGVYRYKNHWPVQNYPLFLYNTMKRPSVKTYSWLAVLWKYSPRFIVNRLGPVLIRHIY